MKNKQNNDWGRESNWTRRGVPNPGSAAAEQLGCKCPVMDNHHGDGIVGGFGGTPDNPVFWQTDACEVHSDNWVTDPTKETESK